MIATTKEEEDDLARWQRMYHEGTGAASPPPPGRETPVLEVLVLLLLFVCRQDLDGVSVAVRRRIGVGDPDIEHRQSTSLVQHGVLH